MKNVFLLFLAMLIISCNSKPKLNSIQLFELSKIDIKFSISLDSIVSAAEIIPLEKNDSCLIGKITSLAESEKFFFVVSNNILYKFDKLGKFIKKIGTEGRGPQEYLAIKNIEVDEEKKIIYILDNGSKKILKFGYDGSFISFLKLNLPNYSYVGSFFLYKDRVILRMQNNSVRMEIYSYNELSRKWDTLSMKERDMVTGEGVLGEEFNFGPPDEPLLFNYFNDTVYKLKDFKLVPDYLIETGDYKFTFEELINLLYNPIPGSKIQIFNIIKGGKYTFVFYTVTKFNNKQWNSFLALYNNETGSYYQNVRLTNDKYDYMSLTAYDLIFSGNTEESIIKIQNPVGLIESGTLFNVKEDDNPVLIKYKIK